MANLNIGASLATVNTLANLPVNKGTIYATLSSASIISLSEAMYQGQEIYIVINPTAKINLPMPTASGWYTTFGETLMLINTIRTVLSITCIGNGQYLIDCKTSGNGNKINGYEYVDLGLPSGTLWATCNVGASQPYEAGKYFQWGATEGYYSGTTAANHSTWSSCPFNNGLSSYSQSYFETVSGTVLNNVTDIGGCSLQMQYDAARTNMGGVWRMPTYYEMMELIQGTTSGNTYVSGMQGIRLTSKTNSSNSIFIPDSFSFINGIFHTNTSGIRSCTLELGDYRCAYGLNFFGSYPNRFLSIGSGYARCIAVSVRGVI